MYYNNSRYIIHETHLHYLECNHIFQFYHDMDSKVHGHQLTDPVHNM